MRFLVLCPYLPFPPDHGGRIRSGVLLRALGELGTVEIAAPVAPGTSVRVAAEAAGIKLRALPTHESTTSVRRKLGHWLRRRSDLLERRWSSEARERVGEFLDDGDYTAVVVDSTFALPLMPRTVVAPVVLHLHNVESAIFARASRAISGGRENLVRFVEARMIAGLESSAAARAALTITVSQRDHDLVIELAPSARVAVVENSVDVDLLPVLPPAEAGVAPVLLFVGSFDYPPNVEAVRELVTEHVPALREHYPELIARVVGRDSRRVVSDLGPCDGVEAVGFVEDLRASYEDATVCYLPLRTGGGTRIKAIEAFAYGRPVLSTRVGIEGLGVVEGEHYLSCETPADGARSLARVLAGDAEPMTRAARALVEARFGHDTAVQKLREAILQAVT